MVKIQKRVPFDLCDPVGIIFFSSVFTLAHQALEEALPLIGIPWKRWFYSNQGAPIRHVECDYHKPLKANDNIEIQVRFTQITTSSVTANYQFYKSDELYCEVNATKVFVDRSTFKKTAVPEDLKEIFLKHSQ